jgi:hypothetical protein
LTAASEIEVRCPADPIGPGRLFAKLLKGDTAPVMVEGNLLQISCEDCRRVVGRSKVKRVLHNFNFLGELVTTGHQLYDGSVLEYHPDGTQVLLDGR